MDFSQVSLKVSVWRKNVHSKIWLWLNDFQKSYVPSMNIFVCSISQYLLNEFQSNFMENLSVKPKYEYYNLVMVEWFLKSNRAFMDIFIRSISQY